MLHAIRSLKLRSLLRPRLWWLLVVPLVFYLTREASVFSDISDDVVQRISVAEYEANAKHYTLRYYRVMTLPMEPLLYQVLHFIAIGCLLIGFLSVAKELLVPYPATKPKPSEH